MYGVKISYSCENGSRNDEDMQDTWLPSEDSWTLYHINEGLKEVQRCIRDKWTWCTNYSGLQVHQQMLPQKLLYACMMKVKKKQKDGIHIQWTLTNQIINYYHYPIPGPPIQGLLQFQGCATLISRDRMDFFKAKSSLTRLHSLL